MPCYDDNQVVRPTAALHLQDYSSSSSYESCSLDMHEYALSYGGSSASSSDSGDGRRSSSSSWSSSSGGSEDGDGDGDGPANNNKATRDGNGRSSSSSSNNSGGSSSSNRTKWLKSLWTIIDRIDGDRKSRDAKRSPPPVKTILRPPTTYKYVIGMSGFPSKVAVYPKRM